MVQVWPKGAGAKKAPHIKISNLSGRSIITGKGCVKQDSKKNPKKQYRGEDVRVIYYLL